MNLKQFAQLQNINNPNKRRKVKLGDNNKNFKTHQNKKFTAGLNVTYDNNDEEIQEEKAFIKAQKMKQVKNTNYNVNPSIRVNNSDEKKAQEEDLMKNLRLQKEKTHHAQQEHQEEKRALLMEIERLKKTNEFEKFYKLNEELDTDPNFLSFVLAQQKK